MPSHCRGLSVGQRVSRSRMPGRCWINGISALVMSATLAACGNGGSTGGSGTTTPTAATPTFSPGAGTYAITQSVSIASTTAGATIYYTTNGTAPTTSSTKYSGAISVATSETLEAIAVASGYTDSQVASATYTITPVAATPTFSPPAGTYSGAQTVSISDATSGATIYYTSNGTAPTTSSTKYTGAITVASSETIEAIAVASGDTSSAIGSATYTIMPVVTPVAATPVFSPGAGTYSTAQTVSITDATAGATIYYTTNGSAPTTSSTKYTGAITVVSSETLEAIAVASGDTNSAAATAAYTITPIAGTGTLTTLYSFDGLHGAGPTAPLIQGTDGNFYGTLENGPSNLSGFVFKMSPSGQLLASIPAYAKPTAPVVQASDGNFYGTTSPVLLANNDEAFATVFQLTPGDVLNTIYTSTTTPIEGPNTASAGLVQDSDGAFYGTTQYGGANGMGSIYKITTAGVVTTLYSFGTVAGDGSGPLAGLTLGTDGNFYGSTNSTIFRVTANGALTTLCSLTNIGNVAGNDATDVSVLVQGSDGNFYGTTQSGGANAEGIIFQVTPSGMLTLLYSFAGLGSSSAGTSTVAGLIQASDGNFYGTTQYGGANGAGSIYRISSTGSFTTLYSFPAVSITDVNDGGAQPTAGLLQGSDGDLYGTTFVGGPDGAGTVFKFSLGLPAPRAARHP